MLKISPNLTMTSLSVSKLKKSNSQTDYEFLSLLTETDIKVKLC